MAVSKRTRAIHSVYAGQASITGAATVYLGLSNSTIEGDRTWLIPSNIIVQTLYIDLSQNGLSDIHTVQLRKNGSNVGTSFTIPASTAGQFSQAQGVSFVAGDRLSLQIVTNASSSASLLRGWGYSYLT